MTSQDDLQAHIDDDIGLRKSFSVPSTPFENRTTLLSGNVEEKASLSFLDDEIQFQSNYSSDEQNDNFSSGDHEQTQSGERECIPDVNISVNPRERTHSGQSTKNQDTSEDRRSQSLEIEDHELEYLETENIDLSVNSNANINISNDENNIQDADSSNTENNINENSQSSHIRPLDFPVGVIHKQLKANRLTQRFRIQKKACAYLSATLSYLTSEVLDLGGNRAKNQHTGHGRPLIQPR